MYTADANHQRLTNVLYFVLRSFAIYMLARPSTGSSLRDAPSRGRVGAFHEVSAAPSDEG